MQITGTNVITAPGAAVWNALNDPEMLRRCLPGCESVERSGADAFKIVMTAAVGPLRARFNGLLRITDARPPTACVLVFEGQGGAMGFGKGSSTVALREVPGGTELSYTAQAQVGGKLAQVGSRLIDSVARKMSDDFFRALHRQLTPEAAAVPAEAAATAPSPEPAPGSGAPAAAGTAPSALAAPAARAGQPAGIRVPVWWLAPAVALGAVAAIAGALLVG